MAKKLTDKAGIRLRREHFWTTGLTLAVRFTDKTLWEAKARFVEAQDTPRFLKALDELWQSVPDKHPLWLAVTLHPLIAENRHTASLFENPKQEALSRVMDEINEKFGNETAYFASLRDRSPDVWRPPTRIAFSRIPDLKEF